MSTESANDVPADDRLLLERRDHLLGPAYRLFYEQPFHPVRASGVWMYDRDGRAFLDAYNNVPSVGHCHPRVVDALSRQAATLNTHTRYLDDGVLEYAERLLATFPDVVNRVMLTCTGSEANDLAVRLSREVTGNEGFLVTSKAYHGVTATLAGMSPSLGTANIASYVRMIDPPDAYRNSPQGVKERFTQSVEHAIEELKQAGMRPAAILLDTSFAGDGGLVSEPAGFIVEGVKAVRAAGGLYIADEVQAGLARPGTHMWCFQLHDIAPDIVTLGKPMGNGHPLAGMLTRSELLAEFGRRTRYFNTFGGNNVSSAVGLAVLDVIRDEGLMENARIVGTYLRSAFNRFLERFEFIGDVRSTGLYLGLEMVTDRKSKTPSPDLASRVLNDLRRNGVLVGVMRSNVMKIRPPLPFSLSDADVLLERMDDVLRRI